jgi:hypothetical protein
MIGWSGFLTVTKLSFNCDRRSTLCFKFFASFQKVNSFPGARKSKRIGGLFGRAHFRIAAPPHSFNGLQPL